MTSALPVGWRVCDANNRPLHNARVWAIRDGALADNWLDPKFETQGQRVRRTNAGGEVCNGPDDGKPRGFHLRPGDYTIHIAAANGAPLYDFPVTVSDGGTMLVLQGQVQQMAVQPAHLGVTINAGERTLPAVRPALPPPEPARLMPVAAPAEPVHIREAIRELIKRI